MSRWDNLISDICTELVKIHKLPKKSMEDMWIEGTLKMVLKKMCALQKLPPKDQRIDGMTRTLFEPLTS